MAPNVRYEEASSCFVTSDYTIRFISIDLDFAKIFILSLKLFRQLLSFSRAHKPYADFNATMKYV